jgi:diaminopimelate epimerase
MRMFNRDGSEGMMCGNGIRCVAKYLYDNGTAVAAVLNGYCQEGADIRVMLLGGELTVNYTPERVLMTGTAHKVFEGEVEI